jgi:hypothetical protein
MAQVPEMSDYGAVALLIGGLWYARWMRNRYRKNAAHPEHPEHNH